MRAKLHPLVQNTKDELLRLDKLKKISWDEQLKYNSKFLPISVEPKLRKRALTFMNDLINLLEINGHSIMFEHHHCHIEMYGQLTEINLRQKTYRKRIKNSSGYSSDTYEKSNDLEFQIGYSYRKGWIDKKTKTLEEYLPNIYAHIEKKSKEWAELREHQRIQEEERKIRQKLEEERAELLAIENAKIDKLKLDANNHIMAAKIRSYLEAYEKKMQESTSLNIAKNQDYIEWAYKKADEIDPLSFKEE